MSGFRTLPATRSRDLAAFGAARAVLGPARVRTTHHVFRPTWLRSIETPIGPSIERARALYRTVEVHAFAFRPRLFELIASTSSVPQLEGFVQHLFRAISRAHGGGIFVGRATRVPLSRKEDISARMAEMRPLVLLPPVPVRQQLALESMT